MDIYHEIESLIATRKKLLFGVSLGRDCACMLHLFFNKYKIDPKEHSFVHYIVYDEMLPYQQKQLEALEKLYGFTCMIRPDPYSYLKKVRSVADERDMLLSLTGAEYWVTAIRMDESLQRRGMMKRYADGINNDMKEAYPLRSWTRRIRDNYVKVNNIHLAPEYAFGLHDCRGTHRGMLAVWLRHEIGEEEFKLAVKFDPQVMIDYVRYEPLSRKV